MARSTHLVAIETIELWQECASVLHEVHVVLGQEFLQEVRLLVLHCLDDELVVGGDVEDRATGTGVREFSQLLGAQGVLQGRLGFYNK